MTSQDIRDQESDHLLTPKNTALIIIDYQPEMLQGVESVNKAKLVNNIVGLAKVAKGFDIPIILSTVGVNIRANHPTIPELASVLSNITPLDRTTLNVWEDIEFQEAVKNTGRKKLIICGLWTEICLAFPALDALKEGYDVYVPTDAVGGVTSEDHERAIQRIVQAGAIPVTWIAIAAELQRDWSRKETANTLREALQKHFTIIHHIPEQF